MLKSQWQQQLVQQEDRSNVINSTDLALEDALIFVRV